MIFACKDVSDVIFFSQLSREEDLLNFVEVRWEICLDFLFGLGLHPCNIFFSPFVHSLADEFWQVLILDFEGQDVSLRIFFLLSFFSHFLSSFTSHEVVKNMTDSTLFIEFSFLDFAKLESPE